MLRRKLNNQGFTLLELLVVIAIIGILLSFAAASFSTSQKRSRDVQRKSDTKAIQQGLEQYYAKNDGVYPVLTEYADLSSLAGLEDIFPGGAPSDPRNNEYTLVSDTTGFCVCSRMESDPLVADGNADAVASSTTCSFTQTTADSYFYCLSNLQ